MAFNIGELPILLLELTCSKCKKLLSVPPIYTSSNNDKVCGRCDPSRQSIPINSLQRNTVYETLARHALLFPCLNRKFGCKTSLKYDEVVGHEEYCIYRQLICPFNMDYCETEGNLKCDWKGRIIDLSAHLNLHHPSRKIMNSRNFTLMKKRYIQVNYVKVQLYTFVIITRRTAFDKFHCLVMCCAEEAVCKSYKYQLEFVSTTGYNFVGNLSKVDTSMMLDTSDALGLVQNTITFDVNAALTFFGNLDLDLQYRISITKKPNKIAETITSIPKELSSSEPTSSDAKPNMSHSNKLILEELECPVCNNYMKPPIYICTQGHSLCNECKIKVNGCPICRVSSVGIRNLTLEKLTQKVLYPCRYSHNRCTEVLSGCVIAQHETTCNFRSNCPLFMFTGVLCDDVGETTQNLIDHIHEKHSDILAEVSASCIRDVKSSVCTYRVLITNEQIFIFCYETTTGSIKFKFLHLDTKENVPMYRYRLKFIDQTLLGSKLIVQQVCQPLPASLSDVFQNCLNLPLDLLGPYITSDMVHFKVNMEKI